MATITILCALVLISSIGAFSVSADDFSPKLLKISADPSIMYEFRGQTLDIPVTVEGTPAGLVFSIFTKECSKGVRDVRNGYLGWHYMNRVDTCLYYSELISVQPGEAVISWDGCDQDGVPVRWGTYTYYIWAYDNQSPRKTVTEQLPAQYDYARQSSIIEVDKQGLPLATPVICQYVNNSKDRIDYLYHWMIGGDPEDSSRLSTSTLSLEDGWRMNGNPLEVPGEENSYYIRVSNAEEKQGSLQKIRFIDSGVAEIEEDWGEKSPYGYIFPAAENEVSAIASDGEYIYTTSRGEPDVSEPDANFYIYDMDGYFVEGIDISDWWCSAEDYGRGGQMNGGPEMLFCRNGLLFLNSHASCLNQMLAPQRYLDSGDPKDLIVWANGNGDYTLDKNGEATAEKKWVCNDNGVGPYKLSISADAKLFSAVNSWDVGKTSFGLFAPDGTGLGYFDYYNNTASAKYATLFIDSGTAYDGLYSVSLYINSHAQYTRPPNTVLGYVAHDSIKGVIWDTAHCYSVTVGLVSPAGGEIYQPGSQIEIIWEYYNYQDYNFGCNPYTLTLEYSTDSGGSWERIAAGVDRFAKSYTWTVPEIESEQCLLRVMSGSDYHQMDVTEEPFTISSDVAVTEAVPNIHSLSQNSPNPFNPVTTIEYSLAREAQTTLTVYSVTGEKVATLADGLMSAGKHSAVFDGSNLASGMYFYRLEADGMVKSGKMMLLK